MPMWTRKTWRPGVPHKLIYVRQVFDQELLDSFRRIHNDRFHRVKEMCFKLDPAKSGIIIPRITLD